MNPPSIQQQFHQRTASNRPIAPIDTPDPWILHHNNLFYFTFTLGDRIELWSSPILEDFHDPAHTRKSVLWRPGPDEHWSADLWAPELHLLPVASTAENGNGREVEWKWYIYFAACPRAEGNKGHRTVLLSSSRADPMDASGWTFLGPLRGVPDDQWAIDATVFMLPSSSSQVSGRNTLPDMYCVYSGWPLGDHSDTQQDLFLIQLETPEIARPQTLTCIARAQMEWERPDGGKRGVAEGPTWLDIPSGFGREGSHGGFRGIVYSAHGSWGSDYKLGIVAFVGDASMGARGVCDERSWVKRGWPLLVSDERMGPPFGPGHASFVTFDAAPGREGGGGQRVFCIYHGTEGTKDGWANRKARVLELDVAAFGAGARTVCCATDMTMGGGGGGGGGYSGGMMGGGGGGYPGMNQSGSGGSVGMVPQALSSGSGDKVWKEVEKRVPEQYRGYLNKVKKFF